MLLLDHYRQVQTDRTQQNQGQPQHVQREQAGNALVRTRKFATKHDSRYGLAYPGQALGNPMANAGSRDGVVVVGQGVSDKSHHDRQSQQPQTNQPVQLTRLLVGPRQQDTQHMQEGCRNHDVGQPVMPAAQHRPKGQRVDVKDGGIGSLHLLTVGQLDHPGGRFVVEGEEYTAQDEQHKGKHGDFTQEEGVMHRKSLPEEFIIEAGKIQTLIKPFVHETSWNWSSGFAGFSHKPCGHHNLVAFNPDGELRNGTRGRPSHHFTAVAGIVLTLMTGADQMSTGRRPLAHNATQVFTYPRVGYNAVGSILGSTRAKGGWVKAQYQHGIVGLFVLDHPGFGIHGIGRNLRGIDLQVGHSDGLSLLVALTKHQQVTGCNGFLFGRDLFFGYQTHSYKQGGKHRGTPPNTNRRL